MKKEKHELITGLGISSSQNEALKIAEHMHNDFFTGIELPLSLFETEKGAAVLLEHNWEYIHLTELMDSVLSRRIAEQTPSIIKEFVNNFNTLLDRAHAFQVDSVTVDFSVDSAAASPEIYASLQSLIKSLMPKLYETGIKLCIPLRIPSVSPEPPPEAHLNFLRELMFPGIRFTVNIHPHQLNKDFVPEQLLRWHRFDMEVIRFVYEAEMGNRLVKKLLNPSMEYLKSILFTGALVFCPRVSGADTFIKETAHLREMLSMPEKD